MSTSADSLRYLLGDAITGDVLAELNHSAGARVEASAVGDDRVQCSVLLGAPENRDKDWEHLLLGGSRFLAAVTDDNHVVAAGILSTEFDYSLSTTQLSLNANSIRGWFEKRFVIDVGVDPTVVPETYVSIQGKSPRGVAAYVVSIALQRAGAQAPAIVVPQEYITEPGDSDEYFEAKDFHPVSEVLSDVEQRGYEVVFQPRLTSEGKLIWELAVGNPAVTSPYTFTVNPQEQKDSSVVVDFSEMANTVWGVRSDDTYEQPFITKQTGGELENWLLMETVISAHNEESGTAMAKRTSAEFAAHRLPEQTFQTSLWDETGELLRHGVGSTCLIAIDEDPLFGTVTLQARVLAISAQGRSHNIEVTLSTATAVSRFSASAGSALRRSVAKRKAQSEEIGILKRRVL